MEGSQDANDAFQIQSVEKNPEDSNDEEQEQTTLNDDVTANSDQNLLFTDFSVNTSGKITYVKTMEYSFSQSKYFNSWAKPEMYFYYKVDQRSLDKICEEKSQFL